MPRPAELSPSLIKEIITCYQRGMTQKKLIAEFHISLVRLAHILTEAGVYIPSRRPQFFSPLQEQDVIEQWENGQSMVAIATQYHCSIEPIKRVLATATKLQRLIRPRQGHFMDLARKDAPAMIADYVQGLSSHALSRKYGHRYGYVRMILRAAGIPLRDDRDRVGPAAPQFRTGRRIVARGYVQVLVPKTHPWACMRNLKGYVLEHRWVMAQHLGRPLFPYETVHHRNGNHADNRIENLELWEGSHGNGQRIEENHVPHCPTCTCKALAKPV